MPNHHRFRWSKDLSLETESAAIYVPNLGGFCREKNMSCWSVHLFDFTREKLHERFSAIAVFPAQNRTNWQTNKTRFALITHLLSIRASWKMLMNNEFKADTSTGNPTGNSRCHTLTSRALNVSCSFGQSARSVESRCVVNLIYMVTGDFFY